MAVAAPTWGIWSGSNAGPGDEWVSRLDDLDPEDVERIEVLGGPAAAARYGFGAAAGAIVVTTRRAMGDGLHWSAHASSGAVQQRGSFPWNFDQRGIDRATGAHVDYCGVDNQAWPTCTAIPDSLLRSNALITAAPFRTGLLSRLGASGSAGGELGSIYISTDVTRESGAVRTNDTRRGHVLAHGVIHPLHSLTIGARAGYGRASLAGWRPDDQNIFYSALVSGPDDADGYDISPDTVAMLATARGSARFIFGGTMTWEPARWLRIGGTLGEDRNVWVDDQNPPAYGFGSDVKAWNRASYYEHLQTTRVEASSMWRIGKSLRVTPGIGWDRVESKELGSNLLFNSAFSTTGPAAYSKFARYLRVDGISGRMEVVWRDRLTLTGGVRSEKSWRIDDQEMYPMAGASWALSSESWFPHPGFLDELRVRAAYGEAGQSRRLLHDDEPIVLPIGLYEPSKVHRPGTSETELGLDAAAWHRRLALSITRYGGRSDAEVITLPLSSYTPPVHHPGTIRSSGVEIGISASLVEAGPYRAGLDLAAAFPHTEYRGFPEFLPWRQRMVSGYPVAGYWSAPILGYADLDQDHLISTKGCYYGEFPSRSGCEVTLGEMSYIGPSAPTRELSLRPHIAAHRVTLSALFDYRGGNKLFNATDYFRCPKLCRAGQDRDASPGDQARAAAAALGSVAGFIEDADFWKLRELSLACAMPDAWAAALGAKRLSLELAARNVATWTGYDGPDPEANTADYESPEYTDMFAQPQVRYLLVRVDVAW